MKNSNKKLTALLLAMAMLLPTLASCSESNVNTDETTPQAGEVSAESTEETAGEEQADELVDVINGLPEANYDGYTFTQWCQNQLTSTIFMRQAPDEELSGEPINDALWERDRALENKYNITMDYVVTDVAGVSLYGDAAKLIQAGDDSVGLIYAVMVSDGPSFVNNGLTIAMSDIDQVDLSKPYWSQNANTDLAIQGRVYYATGDITTRYAGAPYLLLFNKQLLADRGFAEPYDDVIEGTWTFDKLQNIVTGQYQDLNGNGKVENEDFFGFAYEKNMQGFAFYNGFGFTAVDITGEEAVISVKEEAQINGIDTLSKFAQIQDVWLEPVVYGETKIFEEDRSVFVGQTACNLFMLTDMESDFGVLPVPKQNEEQDAYYSYANLHCATCVLVPKSTLDLDRTGTLVEAIAAASRVSSMRAQYEVTLQYRQTRDEPSVRMLQIISEAATYDPANMYNLGSLYGLINQCIDSATPISSKLKSVDKMVPKVYAKLVKNLVGEE